MLFLSQKSEPGFAADQEPCLMSAQGRWDGCLWSILNKPKKKSSYIPQTNLWCGQEPSQSDFSCIFIHQRHQFAPLPSPLLLAHGHLFFCAKGVKQMLPPETHLGQKRTLWSSVFSPSGSVTRRTRPQKTHINVTKVDKGDCKDGEDSTLRLCKWNEGEEVA